MFPQPLELINTSASGCNPKVHQGGLLYRLGVVKLCNLSKTASELQYIKTELYSKKKKNSSLLN